MLFPDLSKEQISTISKFLVFHCFRNGPIADIHDDQDGGSRISQEEMKLIMQTAVTEVATVMDGLINERGPYIKDDHWKIHEIMEKWDEPDWAYVKEINKVKK